MREVGWVVFDEIHYMRDKERGVVWEGNFLFYLCLLQMYDFTIFQIMVAPCLINLY